MDVEQIRKATETVSKSIRDGYPVRYACIHALISVKTYDDLRIVGEHTLEKSNDGEHPQTEIESAYMNFFIQMLL